MDALILAGGTGAKEITAGNEWQEEALIPVGDRIMVDFVVRALEDVPEISRIAVVGPQEQLQEYYQERDNLLLAPAGEDQLASLLQGLEVLKPQGLLLVATGDIPLLTPQAVSDFLGLAKQRGSKDLYYPIIEKKTAEAAYPGVKRTYIPLKEGTFTGGNLFLVRAEIILPALEKGRRLVALRKNPLGLARVIGWDVIIKFLLKRLDVGEVERRVSKLLNLDGAGIVSAYPEIGVDVDKPSDLELVRSLLTKK